MKLLVSEEELTNLFNAEGISIRGAKFTLTNIKYTNYRFELELDTNSAPIPGTLIPMTSLLP